MLPSLLPRDMNLHSSDCVVFWSQRTLASSHTSLPQVANNCNFKHKFNLSGVGWEFFSFCLFTPTVCLHRLELHMWTALLYFTYIHLCMTALSGCIGVEMGHSVADICTITQISTAKDICFGHWHGNEGISLCNWCSSSILIFSVLVFVFTTT